MMQHQYWVTKKTVLKKLGTKEDECIVASDAELDAKLELFRSISDSCLEMQRVLDQYQQRITLLATEENMLGIFLEEAGKTDDAAAKHMVTAGRAITFSAQHRLLVRLPLLRLYQEVETFRCRAVKDTRGTIAAMEKARTEYRAAMSWMKSASAQLDPDKGRGLDNYRKAQRQVRESKKIFDKLTLDVLQKIDLLAAARCNMFSHEISSYQSALVTFSAKVTDALTTSIESMNAAPQYEFCILKSLGESDLNGENESAQNKNQMLFFQDEYGDEKPNTSKSKEENPHNMMQINKESKKEEQTVSDNLINTATKTEDDAGSNIDINSDLVGLNLDGDQLSNFGSFMPSQLLGNLNPSSLLEATMIPKQADIPTTSTPQKKNAAKAPPPKKDDKAAWFKLFAELDPLANPDNLPCSNTNQSHAA